MSNARSGAVFGVVADSIERGLLARPNQAGTPEELVFAILASAAMYAAALKIDFAEAAIIMMRSSGVDKSHALALLHTVYSAGGMKGMAS